MQCGSHINTETMLNNIFIIHHKLIAGNNHGFLTILIVYLIIDRKKNY